MPTGYTSPLYDGQEMDFATFALRCARGLMPTVMLRDADPDVLPTEENVVEPDSYYTTKLASLRADLARVEAMDETEIEAAIDAEIAEAISYRDEYTSKGSDLRERYESMLDQVESWDPPTEDHASLKELMTDQLTRSLKFDCDSTYLPSVPERVSPDDWRDAKIARICTDIAHSKEELVKMDARNAFRKRWIKELREDLEAARV